MRYLKAEVITHCVKDNSYIIMAILANNSFFIVTVNELATIKYLVIDYSQYSEVEKLILNADFNLIKDSPVNPDFHE